MSFSSNSTEYSTTDEGSHTSLERSSLESSVNLQGDEQADAWRSHLKPAPVWEKWSSVVWRQGVPRSPCTPRAVKPSSPETVLQVVHPSGSTMWVPYLPSHTTVDMLKAEIARMHGWSPRDFQLSSSGRMLPVLSSSNARLFVDMVCHPGSSVFIIPRLPAMHFHPPSHLDRWDFSTLAPGIVMSYDSQGPTCPTCHAAINSAGGKNAASVPPTQSISLLYNAMPLEEKMHCAAQYLMLLINNTKHMQVDIEAAVAKSVDCTAVFHTIEANAQDLILHPTGNYLLSKCFDLHPHLIALATGIISADVRKYVLHKHGSYVCEAILTHTQTTEPVLARLISSFLSPGTVDEIAAHDSGNFVLQKAIAQCPDALLATMVEAVTAALPKTPHASKMSKKLQYRASRSPGVVELGKRGGGQNPRSRDAGRKVLRHGSGNGTPVASSFRTSPPALLPLQQVMRAHR